MNRPAANEILKNNESCYSLVIAVAKRAREIAIENEEKNINADEKPVKTAVEEFYNGKCKLTESTQL